MTQRSVVLAGGGVAGIAWLLGVVTALRDAGVDLGTADQVAGTSAGSAVATQLTTGALDEAARTQQQADTPERAVAVDADTFFALAADAAASATSPQDAARRMAALPLQQHDIGPDERRAIVAARLPVAEWPDRDLRICVVAQDTGERVVFNRHGRAGLVDAVTASCAVPGVWPPVTIDGRTYVDGGAHSLTNADIAAIADRALILVPVVPSEAQSAQLDAERAQLGASCVLSADDEAGAAFGPNPLDPSRRPEAYLAGRRQGAASAAEIRAFWE